MSQEIKVYDLDEVEFLEGVTARVILASDYNKFLAKAYQALAAKDAQIALLENALKQIASFEIHMGSDYILWQKMKDIALTAITVEKGE